MNVLHALYSTLCVNRDAAAAQSNNRTHFPPRDKGSLTPALTFVFVLHVLYQQGQVAVVGRQQGFDPALLTGLVLCSKLVGPEPRLAPHQREGELLLRLAQLDGAALQNNHSRHVSVCRPLLVEEEVSLQHKPALLIGSFDLTLRGNMGFT